MHHLDVVHTLPPDGHLDSGHIWSHDVCLGERTVDDITRCRMGYGLGHASGRGCSFWNRNGHGRGHGQPPKLVAFVVVWIGMCTAACLVSFACEERQVVLEEVLAIFAAVHTHVWLDLLTSYGTNITHPFNRDLFAFNVVHVFHPVATLVMAAPWIWFKIKGKTRWDQAGRWSLMLFGLFLVWPVASKIQATNRLESSLPEGIQSLEVVPTPFNSWMWHGLADAGDSLGVATIHMGKSEAVEWHWVQNDRRVLESMPQSRQVETYLGFCGDFPLVVRDSVAGMTESTPRNLARSIMSDHPNSFVHL